MTFDHRQSSAAVDSPMFNFTSMMLHRSDEAIANKLAKNIEDRGVLTLGATETIKVFKIDIPNIPPFVREMVENWYQRIILLANKQMLKDGFTYLHLDLYVESVRPAAGKANSTTVTWTLKLRDSAIILDIDRWSEDYLCSIDETSTLSS